MDFLIPIKLLQKDTKELDALVDEMRVTGLSSVETKAIKKLIISFLKTMRDDLYVVVEPDYVDRVYRDSYYDYYATKLRDYNRNCLRLSFFDAGIHQDFPLDDEENIRSNYLGFIVLRPQHKCIGRNVINPRAIKGGEKIRVCSTGVSASCYGIKLTATGFPHASQDSETMTCAQTTIWMLLEYFGNRYNNYCPTVSSEIEKILTPFVYERQLPSSGLTYNQVSVALRECGLGTKIYDLPTNPEQRQEMGQHFYELFACYIESGIPLAVALVGEGNGHAVVCVGREDIDKREVLKKRRIENGKTIYLWNEAVAKKHFVFNDDNFPCYQRDTLRKPAKRYQKKRPDLAKMDISQFIVPLYNKVYMDADMAIGQSKKLITSLIDNCDENVVRTLLTSSRTFREHIAHSQAFSDSERKALLKIPMPKFIWLTEVSTKDEFFQDKVNSILLLDATGSPKSQASQNMVFMLASGRYYFYDSKLKQIAYRNTRLAPVFESFAGNLK